MHFMIKCCLGKSSTAHFVLVYAGLTINLQIPLITIMILVVLYKKIYSSATITSGRPAQSSLDFALKRVTIHS